MFEFLCARIFLLSFCVRSFPFLTASCYSIFLSLFSCFFLFVSFESENLCFWYLFVWCLKILGRFDLCRPTLRRLFALYLYFRRIQLVVLRIYISNKYLRISLDYTKQRALWHSTVFRSFHVLLILLVFLTHIPPRPLGYNSLRQWWWTPMTSGSRKVHTVL